MWTRQRIGLRYPVEVGLVGDCRRSLEELLPLLRATRTGHFWRRRRRAWRSGRRLMRKQETPQDMPMKPQVVAAELGRRLAATAIVSCDSGDQHHLVGPPYSGQARADVLLLRQPGHAWRAGLPYTIAAQIAYPERQCVAFVGDGGFSMLMAEFATAVKYQLPIKVVVMKNNTLGQIKWEQMVFLGQSRIWLRACSPSISRRSRAPAAAHGFTIDDPADLRRDSGRGARCARARR